MGEIYGSPRDKKRRKSRGSYKRIMGFFFFNFLKKTKQKKPLETAK